MHTSDHAPTPSPPADGDRDRVTDIFQLLLFRRGVSIYRTATRQKPKIMANRALSFRRDPKGQRIQIGAALLLPPRICVSLLWRRP